MCFRVVGFPNRLDVSALSARWDDSRRPDFICEVCNFRAQTGRTPTTMDDLYLCYLDRMVTIDEFHKDSSGTANNLYNLRQIARWGIKYGVKMLAGNAAELHQMPPDHRMLSWFFVDKARGGIKFQTVKRIRASTWNYYQRMEGVTSADIPTSSHRFTHRFDGLAQRLGNVSVQARVFPTRLLNDLLDLLESDWKRARGERKVELALVLAAVTVYFTAGFRANEIFSETVLRLNSSFVLGTEAQKLGVRPHLYLMASAQTKEERHEPTEVPISFTTCPPCRLRPGKWLLVALHLLDTVGRGPAALDETMFLFANAFNVPWTMKWLWGEHIAPRLRQLHTEGLGGLLQNEDLTRYGTNSFRRTYNTMAASNPNPVSKSLLNKQCRWRKKQRKRQMLGQEMAELYFEPDIGEVLRATYYLSEIKARVR